MVEPLTDSVPLIRDERGVLHVEGTRVPLEVVLEAFRDGATPEEIAQDHSALALSQVYAVVAYALRHPQEMDTYLERRRRERSTFRARVEAENPWSDLRDRLLARTAQR